MSRVCLAILFSSFLNAFTTSLYAIDACAPDHIDSSAYVTSVYDGDTVRLSDGNKLRLLGVNTPELYPKPQQGANQAKAALEQLLKKHNYFIKIRFDAEHEDRYGRKLAHIFLSNGLNVSAWLLKQGLGHWIAMGENQAYLDCYQNAEQLARKKHLNLWGRLPNNFVHAKDLNLKSTGFYIVTGQIARVFETDVSIWLELKSGLRLRLNKQDYGNFSSKIYVQKIGGVIMTRGWVYTKHNKLMMNISHPSLIQAGFL